MQRTLALARSKIRVQCFKWDDKFISFNGAGKAWGLTTEMSSSTGPWVLDANWLYFQDPSGDRYGFGIAEDGSILAQKTNERLDINFSRATDFFGKDNLYNLAVRRVPLLGQEHKDLMRYLAVHDNRIVLTEDYKVGVDGWMVLRDDEHPTSPELRSRCHPVQASADHFVRHVLKKYPYATHIRVLRHENKFLDFDGAHKPFVVRDSAPLIPRWFCNRGVDDRGLFCVDDSYNAWYPSYTDSSSPLTAVAHNEPRWKLQPVNIREGGYRLQWTAFYNGHSNTAMVPLNDGHVAVYTMLELDKFPASDRQWMMTWEVLDDKIVVIEHAEPQAAAAASPKVVQHHAQVAPVQDPAPAPAASSSSQKKKSSASAKKSSASAKKSSASAKKRSASAKKERAISVKRARVVEPPHAPPAQAEVRISRSGRIIFPVEHTV